MGFKVPESVLVVIYTPQLQTLMLERTDHPGFWQSVTGSLSDPQEPLVAACAREVEEETGWKAATADFDDWRIEHEYPIFPRWRARYAPGVTRNREHVFGLRVAQPFEVRLAPREHTASRWLHWRAAADACFSWTNAQAIRLLAEGTLPSPEKREPGNEQLPSPAKRERGRG